MSLDALKAEIATKRKNPNNDSISERPNKYMRRGELEKLKEEAERKKKEEQEAAKRKVEEEEREAKSKLKAAKVSRTFHDNNATVLKLCLWRTASPLRVHVQVTYTRVGW